MLKITAKSSTPSPRRLLSAGQRVSKKYRTASHNKLVKKREYKKLKAIVPAISKKNKVPKITVIEEAIKYIDELHVALAKRMHLLRDIAPSLPCQVSPNMLAPGFPFPPASSAPVNPAILMALMAKPQMMLSAADCTQGLRNGERKR